MLLYFKYKHLMEINQTPHIYFKKKKTTKKNVIFCVYPRAVHENHLPNCQKVDPNLRKTKFIFQKFILPYYINYYK